MSNSGRSAGKARLLGPGASAGAGAGSDSGYDRALLDLGPGVRGVVRLRDVVGRLSRIG